MPRRLRKRHIGTQEYEEIMRGLEKCINYLCGWAKEELPRPERIALIIRNELELAKETLARLASGSHCRALTEAITIDLCSIISDRIELEPGLEFHEEIGEKFALFAVGLGRAVDCSDEVCQFVWKEPFGEVWNKATPETRKEIAKVRDFF